LKESIDHGWPSFRDEEVVWENVRCLPNGETVSLGGTDLGHNLPDEIVSLSGTHLGHNIPDGKGNRYSINLVSIAGNPQ
jgi:peptide methionine sulfoxide reductase MsrB